MLLTPINEMSHSKEALILYRCVQGFMIELSAVCLYGLYGKLDTLLHIYYYEFLVLASTSDTNANKFLICDLICENPI